MGELRLSAILLAKARLRCFAGDTFYFPIAALAARDAVVFSPVSVTGARQKSVHAKGATQSPGGEAMLDRKLCEKTNKGFKPQPVLEDNSSPPGAAQKNAELAEIELSQIRTQSDEVHALISYLCNINIHNIVENSAIKLTSCISRQRLQIWRGLRPLKSDLCKESISRRRERGGVWRDRVRLRAKLHV